MPKERRDTGEKNYLADHLVRLRQYHDISQRKLANDLQLDGYDIDKNVITRIETNKRYVTDLELKALSKYFNISYTYLIDGVKTKEDNILYPDL